MTSLFYRLSILVDDKHDSSADGQHRGKKTKTEPSFGYYLGGVKQATIDDISYKNNSPTWKRFIGCMSDVIILNVSVDFAQPGSRPEGDYADYSACPVPDPVDPDATTTMMTTQPGKGTAFT